MSVNTSYDNGNPYQPHFNSLDNKCIQDEKYCDNVEKKETEKTIVRSPKNLKNYDYDNSYDPLNGAEEALTHLAKRV